MRHHYCTLFDKNYLAQGVVMLRSLIRHSSTPPSIYVLALDNETYKQLMHLNLPGTLVVHHQDFAAIQNTKELQASRTHQEYAWTCGSLFTLHCAPMTNWSITYLDADLYFFSDPQVIHTEIGDRSIGIIPHRFNADYQRKFGMNGKFNVSWVTFKDTVGRQCLQDWAIQCREWCYHRIEKGKFGDQKYLDEWPTKYYPHVCEISNPGAGLAPWNVANYHVALDQASDRVSVSKIIHTKDDIDPSGTITYYWLVFYHFHQRLQPRHHIPHGAELAVYKPYTRTLLHEQQQLDNLSLARTH